MNGRQFFAKFNGSISYILSRSSKTDLNTLNSIFVLIFFNLLKSFIEYGEKVAAMNDRNSIIAMKAMTKTLKKSMKCNPHTIQQQLHTFGKGGAASRKSKWGRVIKPNPPAISARLAPGSGPAPLGRRFKDRRGQVVQTYCYSSYNLGTLFNKHSNRWLKCQVDRWSRQEKHQFIKKGDHTV